MPASFVFCERITPGGKQEVVYMATSTFGKQFTLRQGKEKEFVAEMTRAVTPTLQKDFQSNLVPLSQKKNLKNNLLEALNK